MFAALDSLAVTGSLADFARANSLHYEPKAAAPASFGALIELFTRGSVTDRISGPGWHTGNLQPPPQLVVTQSTESGRRVTEVSTSQSPIFHRPPTGYLALTLSRRLPNMILDSKRNNTLFGSSLLQPPTNDQRLSLEGDFDTHFDLFVPSGYERDALYVFTPDLMALMIDESSDFDVEIRGDQFTVYAPKGLDLTKPATWHWIERVMTVLGVKAFSRADGYSDERVADRAANLIAPPGQLLRRSILSPENRVFVYGFVIASAALLIVGGILTVVFLASLFAF
jgi:hypothetical protein